MSSIDPREGYSYFADEEAAVARAVEVLSHDLQSGGNGSAVAPSRTRSSA
ncbi:MAG: hypothetical protein M0Z46_14735 [Actinomycetota bacterium]|nr:hypothetical protein [Actinomycetota bacterium]